LLKDRSADLDDGLLDALRADSAFGDANSYGKGSREELNFDPLLDAQDWCDGTRYAVVGARAVKSGYEVTVRDVCPDTTWGVRRPIVVVSRRKSRWKITNVIYATTNLRALLCEYAKADLRPENREKGCSRL
jgi:hypothetical protein